MTPQQESQFTLKMKANAVPRLLSSLVWIDQYNECNGMTRFKEFMITAVATHNTISHCCDSSFHTRLKASHLLSCGVRTSLLQGHNGTFINHLINQKWGPIYNFYAHTQTRSPFSACFNGHHTSLEYVFHQPPIGDPAEIAYCLAYFSMLFGKGVC